MKRIARAAILSIALVLGVGAAIADAPPKGFKYHAFNPVGQEPQTEDGITTFHLSPGVCSSTDYGDGRGENDCNNGNLRSVMMVERQAKIGQELEYRFDLRVDPAIKYAGFNNMGAAGYYPGGIDSGLRVASWEGPFLHNFIYHVKVSTTHGVDFLAKQCQSPGDFGKWVEFSLKIKWARDEGGWLKVTCDGKVIYADEGIATNQAPFCWESNQCEPWLQKDPDKFLFVLGPVLQGFGPDWEKIPGAKSLFAEIQEDGITIQVRNASVRAGAKLYDAEDMAIIRQLQSVLIDLGCDPGPADGVSGKKTRDAAQSCRKFPDGTLPPKLTVATAQTFLSAYTSPDAKKLPLGSADSGKKDTLLDVEHVVHVAEESAMRVGHDTDVNSNILAKVKDWKKSDSELFFGLVGTFDYEVNSFSDLGMFLQDSLGEKVPPNLQACGKDAFVVFPDGSVHVFLNFSRVSDTEFAAPSNYDCIMRAVPESHGKRAAFLVENFADIAVGMVQDKTLAKVRHDGLKTFLQRVAIGEVAVGGPIN